MTRYIIERYGSGHWYKHIPAPGTIFDARAVLIQCEARYPQDRFRLSDLYADKPKPQLVWVNPMMAG